MDTLISTLSGRKSVWRGEARARQNAPPNQARTDPDLAKLAKGIVHDFNNLLHPIIGYTQLAMDIVPADSKARGNLEEVLKAAGRARDLVRQFLVFGLNDHTNPRPLHLQNIIEEVLKSLRAYQPNTIEIRGAIGKECGMVLVDPTQIHRVIMNLCTNACHAMQPTGGALEVGLTEVEIDSDNSNDLRLDAGAYICVAVRDTGHGIESAVIDHIFSPFFTTKKEGKGSGLGLFIALGIVRGYGGGLYVTSELGKGTQVDVYLPRFDNAKKAHRATEYKVTEY